MKWKFLFIDEDGDAFGTNDEVLANKIAEVDTSIVLNTETGEYICNFEGATEKNPPILEVPYAEDWLNPIDHTDDDYDKNTEDK